MLITLTWLPKNRNMLARSFCFTVNFLFIHSFPKRKRCVKYLWSELTARRSFMLLATFPSSAAPTFIDLFVFLTARSNANWTLIMLGSDPSFAFAMACTTNAKVQFISRFKAVTTHTKHYSLPTSALIAICIAQPWWNLIVFRCLRTV